MIRRVHLSPTTSINLDTTLVNVALPALVRELHATTTVLQWVVDSYNLVFAALLLALPAVLRDHPTAVVPYLVIRDHFTERLYHQRTGYWQPEGRGLEPATAAEHAAALDLLAGGRDEQFAAAGATLIG